MAQAKLDQSDGSAKGGTDNQVWRNKQMEQEHALAEKLRSEFHLPQETPDEEVLNSLGALLARYRVHI